MSFTAGRSLKHKKPRYNVPRLQSKDLFGRLPKKKGAETPRCLSKSNSGVFCIEASESTADKDIREKRIPSFVRLLPHCRNYSDTDNKKHPPFLFKLEKEYHIFERLSRFLEF